MNDAQRKVLNFNTDHGLHMGTHSRLLDLMSELGEVSKEWLGQSDYGRSDVSPGVEWKSEMGDLYYSLLALANETEVDLDEALNETLAKYKGRIDRRKNPGSSAV